MDKAPEAFRRNYTLERWAETLRAAIESASSLSSVKRGKVLVVGHSEGSQVAARLAARSDLVTDVACLASGNASQISEYCSARNQKLYSEGTSEEQLSRLLNQWQDIRKHRADPNRSWLGQPYPYWNSFLSNSTLDDLQIFKGRVFLAEPLDKGDYSKAYTDQIYGSLLAKGRDVTSLLVPGVSHSFHFVKQSDHDGWKDILTKVFEWFLPVQ